MSIRHKLTLITVAAFLIALALVGIAMAMVYPHVEGMAITRFLLCLGLFALGGAALICVIIYRITGAAALVARELAGLLDQCRLTDQCGDVPERLTRRNDEAGMLSRSVSAMMRRVNSVLREKEFMAYHDSLTRLKNRYRLKEDVAALLARQEMFIFALMDIDDFKRINDAHGHAQGDRLLVEMADILSGICAGGAEVYRWGGDEFVLLIPGGEDACREVLERVMEQTRQALLRRREICVSMGVCRSFVHGETYGDLLMAADSALTLAKKQGKGQYVFFNRDTAAQGGGVG